jgi:hypothetical protein
MHGAQLLDNLLRFRATGVPEWVASCEERLDAWRTSMADPVGVAGGDREEF